MKEGSSGKMDENTMEDQKQWKDQDEQRKQWENGRKYNRRSRIMEGSRWTKMDENTMENQEQWKDQ